MYKLRGDAIIRISDGATIPVELGNADYREYLAWLENNVPEIDPSESAQECIDRLWAKGDAIARQGFDDNSRMRALQWLIDPSCPEWRKTRIDAILAWLDSIWQEYYIAKAKVQAGDLSADFPDFPACPWNFSDLLQE